LNTGTKLGAGILTIALVGAGAFYWTSRIERSVQAHQTSSGDTPEVGFASPGRVEGLSDTIAVEAAADGVLKTVNVTEDQFVKKGTVLGEIACDDLNAAFNASVAEADAARQVRVRVLRGARIEEKRVAAKKTAAAQANMAEAKAQLHRQHVLFKGGEVSGSDYDRTKRDYGVARAEFQAAVRAERLLAAPPLPEDKARADAQVLAAESRVQEAQERIKKCSIVAPIDGTVLRVEARPGEAFSTVTPHPLFILADISGRRVKAEVDQRDLAKVTIGQNVVIQGEGLTGKKLTGTVQSISGVMGKKSVFSDDPADKIDRDVLEVTIILSTEDAKSLPIGLRVTVQFLSS
jgi:multidrug resistance efflux pump